MELDSLLRRTKTESFKYTFITILASGINMISMIVFGRIFSVDDYAKITTFQALLANLAVIMTPLQTMICRSVAKDEKKESHDLFGYLSLVLAFNCFQTIVLIVANRPLMEYLHFNLLEYCLFIGLVLLNNLNLIESGYVQGKQRFLILGWAGLFLYLIKFVLGITLGLSGIGSIAIIFGLISGILFSLLYLIRSNSADRLQYKERFSFCISKAALKEYFGVLLLFLIVSLFINNGDILIANLYIDQEKIGLYSVTSILSKISVFLIATPLATMLLPKLAECADDRKRQIGYFKNTILITICLSVAFGIIFVMSGEWIIQFLYGQKYVDCKDFLFPCTVFSTTLSMFWLFYNFALATRFQRIFTDFSFAFGLLSFVCILLLKPEMNGIAYLLSTAMVFTMTVTFVLVIRKNKYLRNHTEKNEQRE